MKRIKSRLAIILAMMMIFTSFEFVGVFAETEEPAAAEPVAAEPAVTETAPAATEEASVSAETEPSVEAPDPVTLVPYSSSGSIVVTWEKSDDPTIKYLVNGRPANNLLTYVNPRTKKESWRYDVVGLAPGQAGYCNVTAYREDANGNRVESATSYTGDYAVNTITYRVRIKKGGTLKAHGGNGPRYLSVRKGQYLDCYGFGGGKYILNYRGSIFYCNKSRTNKRIAIYSTWEGYSREEAEFFVNARGLSSSTGVLVWTNTYTQHTYRFTGAAGRWVCVNDFESSTGKASTPSPTGVSGKKAIWKKIRKRHGIKYWSPYSDINSYHGKKAKWKIGRPSSNGCIRNYETNAYDLYARAPIGTTVLLY